MKMTPAILIMVRNTWMIKNIDQVERVPDNYLSITNKVKYIFGKIMYNENDSNHPDHHLVFLICLIVGYTVS